MKLKNKLIKIELESLQKELPSLEAVYEYLDNFVRENKSKLGWCSLPILQAEGIMAQLQLTLLREADKLMHTDYDAYLRELRHACGLILNTKNS